MAVATSANILNCGRPDGLFLAMTILPAPAPRFYCLAEGELLARVPPSDESDSDLVERANGGDAASFERLVRRHYDLIHRVAWRQTGHRADAEDIAQTVVMQLVERLATWRGEAKFTSWLIGITINASHDHRRGQSRFGQARHALANWLGSGEAASEAPDPMRSRWLSSILSQLDPKLRATIVLVAGEGLSHREAAEQLGVSENTVAWRMHEVRKRLSTPSDEVVRYER